jgi:methionyl aminopeptidase
MITLKTADDIQKMRRAGAILAELLMNLKGIVKPGMTTGEIDRYAEDFIRKNGAVPSEKGYAVPGYPPYPASICASVNDEVVHGIPSDTRYLQDGDIVSVDVMACYQGLHADACYTYAVGVISPQRQALLDVTRESLDRAIAQVKPGATLGDIGHAVESYVVPKGYGVVREYAGHGIGRLPHEAPSVLNYGEPNTGVTLLKGMTIAIEPMIMSGGEELKDGDDGWKVLTADGSDAAHFEKTVLVTSDGAEILTPWH